MIRRFCGGDCR